MDPLLRAQLEKEKKEARRQYDEEEDQVRQSIAHSTKEGPAVQSQKIVEEPVKELKRAPESQTDLVVSDNEIKAKQEEEEKLEG